MTRLDESGLRLEVPDELSFRFADLPTYRSISGRSVKEMDIAWWDVNRNVLWLVELTDYSRLAPQQDFPQGLIQEMVDKATDSLIMIAAARHAVPGHGPRLAANLPPAVCEMLPQAGRTRLAFVVKTNGSDDRKRMLAPLKQQLVNRLRGRCELLGSHPPLLNDHLDAAEYLPLTSA